MIINTLYKIDSIIDGNKYIPPSEIYNNGYSIELRWKNKNNELHNENGPAIVKYYQNGNLLNKQWLINDKFHNENGPAVIGYHENGNVKYKSWYVNDKLHNDSPAIVWYNENGNVSYQEYWKNGKQIK